MNKNQPTTVPSKNAASGRHKTLLIEQAYPRGYPGAFPRLRVGPGDDPVEHTQEIPLNPELVLRGE